MGFESPERSLVGDALLRKLEREALADLDDVSKQERYFVELARSGGANNEAAQTRLFWALNKASSAEEATTKMNSLFDEHKTGLRGAMVPVESALTAAAPAQTNEQRWVSWKRVYNEEDEEIPGSIDKMYRVNIPDLSINQLIDEGHYDYEDQRVRAQATQIEAEHGADSAEGVHELLSAKFEKAIQTDEAKKWLDENKLIGSFKQLLAIGTQLPDEQRENWLVSLDEAWLSRGFYLTLQANDGGRILSMGRRGLYCLTRDRILAARKVF